MSQQTSSPSPSRVLRPRPKPQLEGRLTKKRKGDGDDGDAKMTKASKASKLPPSLAETPTKGYSTLKTAKQTASQQTITDGNEDMLSLLTSTSKKPPSYKSVVQLLTTPLREEERMVRSWSGESTMKTYLVYQCPNQFCKEKNREIWFQKSVGFINPFNHLQSCIASGDASHLYMVYEQNRESKRLHVTGMFSTKYGALHSKGVGCEWFCLIGSASTIPMIWFFSFDFILVLMDLIFALMMSYYM